MHTPMKRARRLLAGGVTAGALVATALIGLPSAALAAPAAPTAVPDLQDGPEPTTHTQEAYAPEDDFTAKWTRADARQLQRLSDPTTPSRENSMPASLTMPEVPAGLPRHVQRAGVGLGLVAADRRGRQPVLDQRAGDHLLPGGRPQPRLRRSSRVRQDRVLLPSRRGFPPTSVPRTAAGRTAGSSSMRASPARSSTTSPSATRPSGRDRHAYSRAAKSSSSSPTSRSTATRTAPSASPMTRASR